MAIKRVLLGNDSRLLREVLQQVIGEADQLEVVQGSPDHADLQAVIERLDPDWVILSPSLNRKGHHWIDSHIADFPAVRFILVSLESHTIKMKWQTSYEEDLTNLSLADFIHLLQRDLQPIQVKREVS